MSTLESSRTPSWRERIGPKTILAALGILVVLVALLLPEAPLRGTGSPSSYSTDASGARMSYELARRMGWRTTRRTAPLDSTPKAPSVQVVLGPRSDLGAHEVHRLLENVRDGGGLIFTLDGGDEIADSLGIAVGRPGILSAYYADSSCERRSARDRTVLMVPTEVTEIGWRRPAPGPVVALGPLTMGRAGAFPVAIGVPLQRGRIAVVSTSELFTNDLVRLCGSGADVVVARAFEYVKPDTGAAQILAFDEYHHGFGMHGGSFKAISLYLSGTSSGHFLAQALLAGLLLVFALAPRPVVPREPERTTRRSPLEHADALGQAFADVGASRTATARLVGGLRRRIGRMVPVSSGVDDLAFLDAVAQGHPDLAIPVASVRRGLTVAISPRELVAVGTALQEIERQLSTSPSHRT